MLRMLACLPVGKPLLATLAPQCGWAPSRLRLQLTHSAKGGKCKAKEASGKVTVADA
jgi:hypothetical protein